MDVGGSMDPYIKTCSQLFTAANTSSHFRDFQYYYFHNCIYDDLYKNMQTLEKVSTDHVLKTLDLDYKVIIVGDANMESSELLRKNGAIYYYQRNETPGLIWLQRIARHFTHVVWLNPDSETFWRAATIQIIRRIFPMYTLTLEGLDNAMKKLVVKN